MKIGMQTWGSHGDIRPFLSLAEGLQADGHEVTLVITCVDHARYVTGETASGLNIQTVASPIFKDEADLREAGGSIVEECNPFRQVYKILDLAFRPAEAEMFAAATVLCKENELIIGHFFHYPLQACAEKANKPYVSVMLQHMAIATRFMPPPTLPNWGKWSNKLLWEIVTSVLNGYLREVVNSLRQQLGLFAISDVVNDIWISKTLTLVAVSPAICQHQPDWPESVKVCGFLAGPAVKIEGTVTESVRQFITAGDPPIYMGFGSLMPKDKAMQTNTITLFTDAVRLAGCRAIIQAPDAEGCGFISSNDMLYVKALPHRQVFPDCSLIVHHGGAGTTQTVCYCGKPSVVIAHIEEQKFWGNELCELGIGAKVLHRRRVNASELASVINSVLHNHVMIETAVKIGRQMRQEDGIVQAIELINQHLA